MIGSRLHIIEATPTVQKQTYAVGFVRTMALAPMDMAARAARASLQYILVSGQLAERANKLVSKSRWIQEQTMKAATGFIEGGSRTKRKGIIM